MPEVNLLSIIYAELVVLFLARQLLWNWIYRTIGRVTTRKHLFVTVPAILFWPGTLIHEQPILWPQS